MTIKSYSTDVNVTKNEIYRNLNFGDTQLLTYHILYPQFSGAFPTVLHKLNRYYRRLAYTYRRHFETGLFKIAVESYKDSLRNGYPFNPFEADLFYEITLNQDCTISLYYDRYEFTGGAHGNTIRFSDSWYLPLCRKLVLPDLFLTTRHFARNLSQIIISEIEKNPESYFPDPNKTVIEAFDPRNFYLSPKYLNIYFNQYDIAPYSSGIPLFSIPYERANATPPACPT